MGEKLGEEDKEKSDVGRGAVDGGSRRECRDETREKGETRMRTRRRRKREKHTEILIRSMMIRVKILVPSSASKGGCLYMWSPTSQPARKGKVKAGWEVIRSQLACTGRSINEGMRKKIELVERCQWLFRYLTTLCLLRIGRICCGC